MELTIIRRLLCVELTCIGTRREGGSVRDRRHPGEELLTAIQSNMRCPPTLTTTTITTTTPTCSFPQVPCQRSPQDQEAVQVSRTGI